MYTNNFLYLTHMIFFQFFHYNLLYNYNISTFYEMNRFLFLHITIG